MRRSADFCIHSIPQHERVSANPPPLTGRCRCRCRGRKKKGQSWTVAARDAARAKAEDGIVTKSHSSPHMGKAAVTGFGPPQAYLVPGNACSEKHKGAGSKAPPTGQPKAGSRSTWTYGPGRVEHLSDFSIVSWRDRRASTPSPSAGAFARSSPDRTLAVHCLRPTPAALLLQDQDDPACDDMQAETTGGPFAPRFEDRRQNYRRDQGCSQSRRRRPVTLPSMALSHMGAGAPSALQEMESREPHSASSKLQVLLASSRPMEMARIIPACTNQDQERTSPFRGTDLTLRIPSHGYRLKTADAHGLRSIVALSRACVALRGVLCNRARAAPAGRFQQPGRRAARLPSGWNGAGFFHIQARS